MKEPASPTTWLSPSARPRLSAGKASVKSAAVFAISIAPPTACSIRSPISSRAAVDPVDQTSESRIEAIVKMRKPRLYIRTRPNMSPSRPRFTTSTAVTTM